MAATNDSIAAIATPPGAGGIGVVRVSGQAALLVAQAFLGRAPTPRHAHFSAFTSADGSVLDRGLLLYFPAPGSYTGEDVLELHAHGSVPVLHALLERLAQFGIRMARPGEFSERAFLNGKLDLAQAEAVADLIAAGTQAAARAAMRSLDGEFSRRVHALTEAVVRIRLRIEAAIDFSDEPIDALAGVALDTDAQRIDADVAELLEAARQGQRLVQTPQVVIVGPPNAGKSSLLNLLARNERAIVSAVPGTTRDVLRETVEMDGVLMALADTAGMRDADDEIEREGIRRARAERDRADIVVLVTETDSPVDLTLLDGIAASVPVLVVRNKIDRDGQAPGVHVDADGRTVIRLSARSGDGAELLRAQLMRAAGIGDGQQGFSARARHVEALERARLALDAARSALREGVSLELVAEDFRTVQAVLGEITGEFGVEDLLGRIFANFCIGK